MLSDLDRRLLESRIAARQAGKKGNTVIGFYRSHTRRNFAVTMEDAALFSTYFRKPLDLFLLIKSNDGAPPTCGLLLRESGKELSGSPCVQFPFDAYIFPMPPRELPEADPQPRTEALVPLPPPASTVSPNPAPPSAAPSNLVLWNPAGLKQLLARWPAWIAIAAGVVLAIAIPVGTHPAYPLRSLGLNVANTGGNLRLSWNHEASRRAARAILFIRDGADEHRFELDSHQLNEGSISYWPASQDVNFRLEWTSPSGTLTESLRAIGAPAQAALPPAPLPPIATAPAVPAATTPPISAGEPPVERQRAANTGPASRQVSRAFTAPASPPVAPPVARAALPEPPVLQPAIPAVHGRDLLQAIVPAPDPNLGAIADTTYHVEVQPVQRRGRSIPLIGKRSLRAEYVPPAPLHQSVIPNVPRRDVARTIDVKVYVNPAGKVDYAELLSRVSKADVDLASTLVFSARRWEFVPARDGADPATGEVILHYRFGPANP